MKRFIDRSDAGQQLAHALEGKPELLANAIILALPRGGVPVAYEIARRFSLPMTVFLVRKLGVPGNEEVAMGAIAEGNICILNEPLIASSHVKEHQLQTTFQREKNELERRLQRYRAGQPLPSVEGKPVILVDDGIATWATVKAAVSALKMLQPKKIVLAVPVASQDSIQGLSSLVDEVICLATPMPFYGVGWWYQSFQQTTDQEVLALLQHV